MKFQIGNQKPNKEQDVQVSDPVWDGTGNNDAEEWTNAGQQKKIW